MTAPPDPLASLDLVLEALAAALGRPVAGLDPAARFSNQGLTSLLAAGLIADLGLRLDRALPATLVWDHPTPVRLASFLSGQPMAAENLADGPQPMAHDDRVAIIAMACRLPGADNPEAFWRLLIDGVDAVGPMPADRWDTDALYDPDPQAPGRMATRWGGFLDRVDLFDAGFFGISPREALAADPQQRLVLELAWELLERGLIPPSSLAGSRTGVFIGAMWADYAQLFDGLDVIAPHSATGRDTGVIANRVSYTLGLMGPSLTVNTACSSSLVALHLAADSLRRGESQLAIAGGVNLIVTPDSTVAMTKFGAMAPDGKCKAFDAAANGYVRGEGAGLVLLKPLSRALADGDRVLAILCATSLNNDGPSNGLTAPSPEAQRAVLRDAYAVAGLDPAVVDYVEAHGTGTQLGDPIEAGSLGAVLGRAPGRATPLIIGSAKTNIGHLEAAAGVAGVIKAVLALHHGVIPPSLHFHNPSPHIDFPGLNLSVPVISTLWPDGAGPRRVGVNSFGFGGTNAHAVLEGWQPAPLPAYQPPEQPTDRPLVFVFAGNGGHWLGMGRDLLPDPLFRAALAECDVVFADLGADWSLLDEIIAPPARSRLNQTPVTQSLIFAIQVGLVRVLAVQGIRPDAVIGHSLGEVAAAWAAGALSLAEAARVVFHRARLQQRLAGQGGMALLPLPLALVQVLLAEYPSLSIAGINAPAAVTVAGPSDSIAALVAAGVGAVPMRIDIAFHSPAMDPLVPELVAALDGLTPTPTAVVFHSTVTGRPLAGTDLHAGYWGRNLRDPVRFADGVAGLPSGAVLVEISPHPVLHRSLIETIGTEHSDLVMTTLERGVSAVDGLSGLYRRFQSAGMPARAVQLSPPPLHLAISAHDPLVLASLARAYAALLTDDNAADVCAAATYGRDRLPLVHVAKGDDAATLRHDLLELADGAAPRPDAAGLHRFYRGWPRRPVTLPPYPFQRQRYWPRPPVAPRADGWLYHLVWHLVPLPPTLPAPDQVTAAIATLPAAIRADDLDRLAAGFAANALSTAPVPTDRFQQRRLAGLRRLAALVATGPEPGSDLAIESRLIRSVGAALPALLSGRADPLDILFPGGDTTELQDLYQRSAFATALAARVAGAVAALARPLSLIEIGGGTGGTTAHLLPLLTAGSRYLFTDLSPAFLDAARDRFGTNPGFRTALLDIEADPGTQGITGTHDVVVAVNVLHATADIAQTLAHVRRLLRPGGLLLLAEIVGDPGWLDLVFGQLEGWWRFSDDRTDSALLPIERWQAMLSAAGFDAVSLVPDGDRQALILARAGATVLEVDENTDLATACAALDSGSPGPVRLVAGDPLRHAALTAYALSAGHGPVIKGPDALALPGEDRVRETPDGAAVARLVPYTVPPGAGPTIRTDALYLITGAAGMLGRAVARWLARRGARHLALLSRRHVSTDDLTANGVFVHAITADVTDAGAIGTALDRIGLPLAGIIHAAGVLSDDLTTCFHAKVDGARVLDGIARARGPCLFIGFSSAAAVWGAPRMRTYAAANAALDALVQARVQAGHPGLSIGWGRFDKPGLLDGDSDDVLSGLGMRGMAPDAAFDLMWRLAGTDNAQAVIADMDWPTFRAATEMNGARALFAELPAASVPQPIINPVTAPITGDRSAVLRRIIADVLGLASPGDLIADRGLFDQGLDSLLAIRLRRALEEALGRPVPAAILFAHPTLAALTRWAEGDTGPTPPKPVAHPAPASDIHDIAIIGIGCRFPGGADDPDSFARMLFDGVDAVGEVPADRWDWRDWTPRDGEAPDSIGRNRSRWGGFLSGIDLFDAAFFGIPPKDAAFMDPQQRLLLETSWRAVEAAGMDVTSLSGTRTGVFVGITGSDYAALSRRGPAEALAAQAITGQPTNSAAGRIAFTMGLTGPALALDTACSSSLVAVHLAVRALRGGECDRALAGGVNLVLAPDTGAILSAAGMLSPTGRCRTFDAGADGFVRAEGCGMLLLRPLADALAAGDPVLAVIRGSAVNHDGRASGFTVPNGSAQADVIRAALADAGAAPADVTFVETHGTGTPLGDPVEAQALAEALGKGRSTPLLVGSVKTNIGHAEAAAGVAGLIKSVIALRTSRLPGSLHFTRLNPHIDIGAAPILVPVSPTDLPEGAMAGVSAFGASGTNAHIFLSKAPAIAPAQPVGAMAGPVLVPLSARAAEGVRRLGRQVAGLEIDPVDLAVAASHSRARLPWRGFAIVTGDKAALADLSPVRAGEGGQLAFLYTGQGAQRVGMARTLLTVSPVFAQTFDRLEAIATPVLGRSLRAILADASADFDDTGLAQPLIFAIGCALTALWRQAGVRPTLVLGHSVGEFAAAVTAGVISVEDGMRLILRRASLMAALPAGGGMRAVRMGVDDLAPYLADEPTLSLAALNGPMANVVAGPLVALDRLAARLAAAGISNRPLPVSHGFHSALLDPVLGGLQAAANAIPHAAPTLPLFGNLTGARLDRIDGPYWRRHAREPVRFADAVRAAHTHGVDIWLEIGPRPVLAPLVDALIPDARLVSSLSGGDDDVRDILHAAGSLWQQGVDLDWDGLADALSGAVPWRHGGTRAVLPPTPWYPRRHWLDWVAGPKPPVTAPHGDWLYGIDWVPTTPALPDPDAILFCADPQADPATQLQALTDAVAGADRPIWLVTRGAMAAGGVVPDATQAALWGLGRALVLSHPGRLRGMIDLCPGAPDPDRLPGLDAGGEDQFVWRDGGWLVPRLRPMTMPVADPFPLVGGTCLITGGLGGLGLALARHLASHGATHLALVGRGDGPVPDIAGAVVRRYAADVGDAASIEALARRLATDLPPVSAIFHAAGVKGGGFQATLSAKLSGTRHLLRLAAEWPVRQICFFASAAGIWGDRDLPDYAAANAALDALAHEGRAAGLQVLSVDWTRLDVAGMLDAEGAVRFDRLGLRPLPHELAFTAMRRAVAGSVVQMLAGDIDWSRLTPILASARPRPMLPGPLAATAPAAVTIPSRPQVLAGIRTLLAAQLGLDAALIDPDQGFFTLGLDSFGLVELRRAVEKSFGIDLPTSALFDAPTLNRLADRIALPVSAPGPVTATHSQDAIAIIGAGLRLPGGVRDLDGLAALLRGGVDAVTGPPADRASLIPGADQWGRGGYLPDIDRFDADFFAISPREAARIDPQHRLLLTCAWEAVAHAGHSAAYVAAARTGVFVGITGTEYGVLAGGTDAYGVGGRFLNAAAGRVAHALGLRGPALAVDTACSSAAMALHLAVKALRAGECDMALAGGANLILSADTTAMLVQARMLAADGRCKTFDATADGYVRAEAVGLVLLKPLKSALADGDRVLAVISGSATNHDGASGGFTVPNGDAQQAVMRAALADAGLDPADIAYVEAHGTGTSLGDPIEVAALDAVYGQAPGRTAPLTIGSIKTNIGHAEAAAGLAGLLKLLVALSDDTIPAHLHLSRLNPQISASPDRVRVGVRPTPWGTGHRRAGLSAFGASGTNVHLLLSVPPAATASPPTAGPVLLALSARRADDLTALIATIRHSPDPALAAREATRTAGRLPHRLTALVQNGVVSEPVTKRAGTPRVAFLFTGQGAQYAGMAAGLYRDQPAFRHHVDAAASALRGRIDRPLVDLLCDSSHPLLATRHVQPALFALGYALAGLWREWGLEPIALLGHSVGEITAACVAGVLTLDDAATLIAERGRLMGTLPAGGAMLSVLADRARLEHLLGGPLPAILPPGIAVAAWNGPANITLSGPALVLEPLAALLRAAGLDCRDLPVSHAFHSVLLDPMLDDLHRVAARLTPRPAAIPLACNLDGGLRREFDAGYWRDQARSPVCFAAGMESLSSLGCDLFLELGPQPVLTGLGRRVLTDPRLGWVASIRRGGDGVADLLGAAGDMWARGADVELSRVQPSNPAQTRPLPAYPFHADRHWVRPVVVPVADTGLFATRLSSPAVTADIRVQLLGPGQVPGLAESGEFVHVGLHLACLSAAMDGQGALADIAFRQSLTLDRPWQIQILRGTDGAIALHARAAGDAGDWSRHVTARVVAAAPAPSAPRPADCIAVATATYDAAAFYAGLAQQGFTLGPRLRRLTGIWTGPGWALATLDLPPADEWTAFGVPAALVEACAQLPALLSPDTDMPLMLAGIDRLTVGTAIAGPLYLFASGGPTPDGVGVSADICLIDASGIVWLALDGALLRPVRRALTMPWMGRTRWRPALLPTRTRLPPGRIIATGPVTRDLSAPWPRSDGGPVLFLAEPHPDGDLVTAEAALAARLAAMVGDLSPGTRVLLVGFGLFAPDGAIVPLVPGGGVLAGLALTMAIEHPGLRCRLVDIGPDQDVAGILAAELADDRADSHSAWRSGRRFLPHLEPLAAPSPVPRHLVITRPGLIDGMEWQPLTPTDPGPGQVRVRMAAVALNFRDALSVMGMGPGAALGADGAGWVEAVGDGVPESLRPGTRVMLYRPGGGTVASHVTLDQALVRPVPPALSLADAATLPMAGMVAALVLLGRVSTGNVVLIHAGGSGVGLAALALCRRLGVRPLVTASRPKQAALAALGAEIIGDSRAGDWPNAARAATGGHGVRLALGAFDDATLPLARACLAADGMLVDLTVRGQADDINLDRLAVEEPVRFADLFDCAGTLPPAPATRHAADDAVDAMRPLAAGLAVGRQCLILAEEGALIAGGVWLLTGAGGGVGRVLARHLADAGAVELILLDRAPLVADWLADLAATGVTVTPLVADASNDAALAGLSGRVTGIIHAAACTADGPLAQLGEADFQRALAPKLGGALALDRFSRTCPHLRHFILLSSVVASLPSGRQAAYAAANAAIDRLVQRRLGLGLPALSIQWGPWSVGIGAALGERAAAAWAAYGVTRLSAAAALATHDRLAGEAGIVTALDIDWDRYRHQMTKPVTENAVIGDDTIAGAVRQVLAEVLGRRDDPAGIDPDRSFAEMGLDSLMAADFATDLSRRLGRPVAATLAYNHPTLNSVIRHLTSVQTLSKPVTPTLRHTDVGDGFSKIADENQLLDLLNQKLATIDRLLGGAA